MKTREFKLFEQRVKESFLGKPTPTRYLTIFGKKFNKKDIPKLAIIRAKKLGIQIYQMGQGVKNE